MRIETSVLTEDESLMPLHLSLTILCFAVFPGLSRNGPIMTRRASHCDSAFPKMIAVSFPSTVDELSVSRA